MAEESYYTSALASVAAANKRHLAIFNASGSGKVLKVYRIRVSGAPTAAVTGLVIPLIAVRITTAPTGGSAGTINKADTAEAAPPAQVTVMTAATGGATEEANAFGIATVTGEEAQGASAATLYDAVIDGLKPLVCAEGQGILVKQGALASAGAVNIVAWFSLL